MPPTADDLRAFFRALSERRFEALEDRLHEDVVFEFPGARFGGRVEGRRRVLTFLRQNQRLFEDGLVFAVHWAGVVGERGVAQWTNGGRTKTRRDYANRGCTVFRFDGEQIVEIQDYLDTEVLAETWPR